MSKESDRLDTYKKRCEGRLPQSLIDACESMEELDIMIGRLGIDISADTECSEPRVVNECTPICENNEVLYIALKRQLIADGSLRIARIITGISALKLPKKKLKELVRDFKAYNRIYPAYYSIQANDSESISDNIISALQTVSSQELADFLVDSIADDSCDKKLKDLWDLAKKMGSGDLLDSLYAKGYLVYKDKGPQLIEKNAGLFSTQEPGYN